MQLLFIAFTIASLAVGTLAATLGELLIARGMGNPQLMRYDPVTEKASLMYDGVETEVDGELAAAVKQRTIDHPPPDVRAAMSKRNKFFPSLRERDDCVVYCSAAPGVPVCGDAGNCNCSCLSMCGPNVGCTPYCSPAAIPGCP